MFMKQATHRAIPTAPGSLATEEEGKGVLRCAGAYAWGSYLVRNRGIGGHKSCNRE